MGQSLATAAVSGTFKSSTADQKQALLDAGDIDGLMALNRQMFGGFSMKLDEDSDDGTGDGDDDAGDDDEDDDEDGGEPDERDLKIKKLSDENKARRQRANALRTENAQLKAEIEKIKGSSLSKRKKADDEDDEDAGADSGELAKAQKDNEGLSRQNEDLLIRLEFTTNTKFKWKNPKAALRLLDLSDVEINDGEVEGLEEAIEALAKSDPYLLESSKDDDDEDDSKSRRRKTGEPTGGARKKGQPNRDSLLKKYPALRR